MRPTPRSLEALVEDHVRRWELAQKSDRPRPLACVALSRLPGSGGALLGQQVAEALEFDFFGIEIVDRIARESRIQRELVVGLDEHVRSAIDRYVLDALRPFNEGDYLRQVARSISTIAERGRAVFLGRGAVFILPPERALRVLAVAPREARLEHLAKRDGLSPAQAEAQLAREEDARREFHRHHFGRDADDPSVYDLVVNTTSLGLDAAAALVVAAWRQRFGRGVAA